MSDYTDSNAQIIQAGSALANTIATGKVYESARKENQKAREWQEQMMDKQNAFNVDMWNKTNEYNSESSVRQRLLNAGINPLTADWNDSSASQISSGTGMNTSIPSMDNPIQAGLDAAALIAQIKNVQANTANTEADTELKSIMVEIESATKGNKIELSKYTIEGSKLNLKQQQKDIAKTELEIEQITKEFDLKLKQYEFQIDQFNWQKAQTEIENEFRSKDYTLQEKQIAIQEFNASIQKMLANSTVEMQTEQKNNLQKSGLYIDAQTGALKLSNDINSAEFAANKPYLGAQAFIKTATGAVSGIMNAVDIANMFMPKPKKSYSTTTENFGADGTHTGTTLHSYQEH